MTVMVPCRGCRHLRQPAQLAPLKLALGGDDSTAAAAAMALNGWIDAAEAAEEAEIENNRQKWATGEPSAEQWTTRPIAHAWCGREGSSAGMCEVRNLYGDCPDKAPGSARSLPCRTCTHLRPPDEADMSAIVTFGQCASELLHSLTTCNAADYAMELHDALATAGYVNGTIRRLPTCSMLSTTNTTVIGPVVNRSESCGLHSQLSNTKR